MTKPVPFEKAFSRLEEILKAMTEGQVSLDDSLKLYEEADKLISQCSKRLTEAESKIEKLIKNRSGEVEEDDEGAPRTESFE